MTIDLPINVPISVPSSIQQSLLNGIVNHVNCMVFLLDFDGTFSYISPSFEAMTGHAASAFVGQSLAPLIHPDDIDRCQAAITQLIQTQQPQSNIEYRSQHQDGNFYWHSANLVLLHQGESDQPHILGLTHNIHDRYIAEVSLKESQQQFQRINANVPGMIYQYRLSPGGEAGFTYVNDFCYRYFGITPEDWISGKVRTDYIYPDDLPAFEQSIVASMQTLQPWQHEWRNVSPITGDLQWLRGQSIPAQQADGSIVWDGIMLDITEHKLAELALQESKQAMERTLQELQQTQTQLVQSEKMSSLGQLVAGVAHEINNPMSFIAGNIEHADIYVKQLLELLKQYQTEYPNPPESIQTQAEAIDLDFLWLDLPKLLSSMRVGSQRVRDIVLNLRNFSRMDESEVKNVNLHDGIDSTLMILKSRLQRSNAQPEIIMQLNYGEIPRLTCHAGQLNQVFMNLIANAIDALDEHDAKRTTAAIQAAPSEISITTQYAPDRQCIQIRICDNGNGIPDAVKSQIFNPFFTTKPVGKGTGMGLAISYQVVTEKHKGQLICNSAPGEGTEFLIELPLHSEDTAAAR
jgi:PAS domain S-box-containing protein